MTAHVRYLESLDRLHWLHHQPVLPAREVGLRRMERLLAELGIPDRSMRVVHVAGSSGKGSTTTMIGSILCAAGHRTGLFRSPHLSAYTERISIGDDDISERDWAAHFSEVWPIVEAMRCNRLPDYKLDRPTHGEVLLALACRYFAAEEVQWAAIETGLGGRLDATNALDSEVAVITNISLEHTQILGATRRAIAAEKAAIIKRGCDAVTATTDPDALEVIRRRSADERAALLEVPADVRCDVLESDVISQTVSIRGLGIDIEVHLQVGGAFQAVNAATATAASLALRRRGVELADGPIVAGLDRARVPGRLEVLRPSPLVIVDGAHNPDAIANLSSAILDSLSGRRIVVLFAAMADKDLPSMAAEVARFASAVVVTQLPDTERAAPARRLIDEFAGLGITARGYDDVDEAVQAASALAGDSGVLLACGSLYLVGRVRDSVGVGVATS